MLRTRSFPRPTVTPTVNAPARVDPLTGQPLPPRGKKHGNQPCHDLDGNRYPSLAERSVALGFQTAHERGYCTKPQRKRYSFDLNGEHIGCYTSDMDFQAVRGFSITTGAGVYSFEAGRHYTCDVKSPATKTTVSNLRFKLMKAFHGIVVMEIYTRPPRKPKAKTKLPKPRTKAKDTP